MRKVPDDEKALRGTDRACRAVVSLYPDHASRPDPADIPPPLGMSAAGKRAWRTKVERYRQRGQKVDGCQDALRQYCELEVELTTAWKTKSATMAMVNAYRMFANEFYDTPASQRVAVSGGKNENPFAKNGKFEVSA